MSETPLTSETSLLIKHGTKTVGCTLDTLRYEIDVNTLHRTESETLLLNGIGRVYLTTHEPIAFDAFAQNRNTGSFILIDQQTNATVAAGMIVRTRKEKKTVEYHLTSKQAAPVVWMTGLSGSGKSTIASVLSKLMKEKDIPHELLDGDVMREAFGNDLSFSKEDRIKNIQRAGYLAHLLQRNGVPVIASFITPYKQQREELRAHISDAFLEIFVDTSLEECEKRDVKGLYKQARAGTIENFTGISDPYEQPSSPHIKLQTKDCSPEQAAKKILDYLTKNEFIS